ncbi:MAG TPA: TetR/AcrR family transcriptional regulator [Kofleriaceae bacterium]|nr:TetR/AcrR family transcriptional regulator [Kofleriaceae bacterium]
MNSRSSSESPKLRRILERAARLIFEKGFDGTSMQDIADACGLTKAGLYHHVATKEALLIAIMEYGMDLFEEVVLARVEHIADPLERLRRTMANNIELVLTDSSKEVTIILHEHQTLTGEAQKKINGRKKRYVRFLEDSFKQAMSRGQIRKVDPTLASFSFLGSVLWTYKWYRPDGRLTPQQLSDGTIDLFFNGLMP